MQQIAPTLVLGYHHSGDWVSRYARFRVDLPKGCHRLTGRTYNPEGEDLRDNRLQFVVKRRLIAEVCPADPPAWRNFSIDLPEIETAKTEYIVLRTTRYRAPSPPDERMLGLILDELNVRLELFEYDLQATTES